MSKIKYLQIISLVDLTEQNNSSNNNKNHFLLLPEKYNNRYCYLNKTMVIQGY
jgi:hypothetical protein